MLCCVALVLCRLRLVPQLHHGVFEGVAHHSCQPVRGVWAACRQRLQGILQRVLRGQFVSRAAPNGALALLKLPQQYKSHRSEVVGRGVQQQLEQRAMECRCLLRHA